MVSQFLQEQYLDRVLLIIFFNEFSITGHQNHFNFSLTKQSLFVEKTYKDTCHYKGQYIAKTSLISRCMKILQYVISLL